MEDAAAAESAVTFLVLDGDARKPGLATMANIVEPTRFLADLERLGVRIERQESGDAPGDRAPRDVS